MADLKASNPLIIVDKGAGQTSGSSQIKYEKEAKQELWESYSSGGSPSSINVHTRTGLGDEADTNGKYSITLKPGQYYEVGVYESGHGPLATDPILVKSLKVFCIWKSPDNRRLVTDQNRATGGTWHWHQIATNVPTEIAVIGASRTPPIFDTNGIPILVDPDGGPTKPITLGTNHQVEIAPLLPGNAYFFVAILVDQDGNWDLVQDTFTTLRRKITVTFKTLHIYNDGDPFDHGEGEFWFRVATRTPTQPIILQDVNLPTMDIDDWDESDRPYALNVAYVGSLEVINPETQPVIVASWGKEHDGWFESDEGAGSPAGTYLPLPFGRFAETVSSMNLRLDCPTSTTGDDFSYGVDVVWSVEYAV